MSGLFTQNNLLLCGVQGKMGFQRKRWKFSKITYTAIRFLLLKSAKFAVRAIACLSNIINSCNFNSSFNGFIMCNRVQSVKVFDTRTILSTPASNVHVRLKKASKAILKNCKRHH